MTSLTNTWTRHKTFGKLGQGLGQRKAPKGVRVSAGP